MTFAEEVDRIYLDTPQKLDVVGPGSYRSPRQIMPSPSLNAS